MDLIFSFVVFGVAFFTICLLYAITVLRSSRDSGTDLDELRQKVNDRRRLEQ